jgi:hypothetical protein
MDAVTKLKDGPKGPATCPVADEALLVPQLGVVGVDVDGGQTRPAPWPARPRVVAATWVGMPGSLT